MNQWLLRLLITAGAVLSPALWTACSWNRSVDSLNSTRVSMRDGVRLETRVYLPGPGVYPVVLSRGYSAGASRLARRFTQAGFVFVSQATRGHGQSEGADGVASRFFADPEDGYDTLTWIAEQPWNNGDIAMFGRSYWAATQWLVAPLQHPNLKAIVPQAMSADLWKRSYWSAGALTLAMTADGRAYQDAHTAQAFGWERLYRFLPLIDLDRAVSGSENVLWNSYIQHSTFDDFWERVSIRADGRDGIYSRIKIPVFLMCGWYDYYAGASFDSYHQLVAAGNPEVRIAVNPADHLNRVVGERAFPDGEMDDIGLAIRWLHHILNGIDDGISEEPPIRIYVMGENRWRFEEQWPPEDSQTTALYLHGGGKSGNGALHFEAPGEAEPSAYTYDPHDPAPTIGGGHSFLQKDHPDLIKVGAYDQRPKERRPDVLVYSTAPLQEDIEVTGPVILRLFASSSARDTDFTATLIDVQPDGKAYNLSEGILRARFREGLWDAPKLMEPGRIYHLEVELQPTSNVFRRGHRIRLHVSSSNWPLWDRNPNTGEPQGLSANLIEARQRIFHDTSRPSHLLLPIIPR